MNWQKLSLCFVPLLIGSLLLKFSSPMRFYENQEATVQQAAAMLKKQGFTVQIESVGNGRITAKRGGCRAQFRLMDSHATADGFYRSTFHPAAKIRYAWRGQWYASRPLFGPLLEFYIKREFVRRGVAVTRSPLWIAGAEPGCISRFPAAFSAIALQMDNPE